MTDDFAQLLNAIQRVFPASLLFPVGEAEVAAIQQRYPSVPGHYLAFLQNVGAGCVGNGNFMIYGGPCDPSEFFDAETAAHRDGIVFFGDDFSGWLAGFDTRNGWRLVGVDSASLALGPEDAKTVGEFVAQRVSRIESG